MSRNAVTLLRAAKALIDTPEKWVRDDMARNAVGAVVCPRSADAVCFCIVGALERVTRASDARIWLEGIIQHELPGRYTHVPSFNDADETTHEAVMGVFDDAIAYAEMLA